MNQRTLIGRRKLVCENGHEARLCYYLLEDRLFGAEIVMERTGRWESASVRRLTTSREHAMAFLERLQHHAVTPCALQDLSTDFLTESNK